MLKNLLLKILAVITFIATAVVNALANILPINNITSGEVSDAYPNLFAPAGLTFSIWGLIYLLLIVYLIYQFLPKSEQLENIIKKINVFFIVSSIANPIWLVLWHYQLITLTVPVMLVILYALIKISAIANEQNLKTKDKLFIKIPFGVYFGWITIATIANIVTFLVSIGWSNLIFPDEIWTVLILLIGAVIASVTAVKAKNIAYGLVPIWAYFGIYLKHTASWGFNNMYPAVVATTISCIAIFFGVNSYLVWKKRYL